MTPEFRNRMLLPILLPVGLLGGIVLLLAAFAAILLWNTRLIALMLAIVAAGSVLAAVALLTAVDRPSPAQRTAVIGAALLPLVLGILSATGVIAAIPDDERNINRQPHAQVATVIAAENDQEFCLPDGGCEPTDEMVIEGEGEVIVVFDNRDTGVPHNWALYELVEQDGQQGPGEVIFAGEIITGDAEIRYQVELPPPGTYWFRCDVHPATMIGTVTIEAGGTGE